MDAHIFRPGEIFVFGSNEGGKHEGGAARFAYSMRDGAVWGKAYGKQGRSYALPTMSRDFEVLPIDKIAHYAYIFIRYATLHPRQQFFLTRVGCGIAGFTDEQIAPLFNGVPSNVRIPPEWQGLTIR